MAILRMRRVERTDAENRDWDEVGTHIFSPSHVFRMVDWGPVLVGVANEVRAERLDVVTCVMEDGGELSVIGTPADLGLPSEGD